MKVACNECTHKSDGKWFPLIHVYPNSLIVSLDIFISTIHDRRYRHDLYHSMSFEKYISFLSIDDVNKKHFLSNGQMQSVWIKRRGLRCQSEWNRRRELGHPTTSTPDNYPVSEISWFLTSLEFSHLSGVVCFLGKITR